MTAKPRPLYSSKVHVFELNGKKYDNDTSVRLTDCCGAYSTFHDTILCCKVCFKEVSFGEGDGSEVLGPGMRVRSKPLPPPPPERLKPASKDARTARLLLAIKEVEKIQHLAHEGEPPDYIAVRATKALKLLRGLL